MLNGKINQYIQYTNTMWEFLVHSVQVTAPPPGMYVKAEQQKWSLLSNTKLLSWLLNNYYGTALSPEMDLKLLTILDENGITMAG